jgi:LCP family protein required for cell wall assembly
VSSSLRHAASSRPRSARHARSLRAHGFLRGVAVVAVALVAFGGTAAYATYAKLNGNIDKVDVSALLTDPTPAPSASGAADPNAGHDLNIALIGSDSRLGQNAEIGGQAGGMRSDTTLVMHISADRSRVELVSIPRDSMVRIPSCTMTNGKTTPATTNMFNSAFATGWDTGHDMASAAGCTINTIQADTGIKIDHFVVVDFEGFEQMVNALGGVQICVPQAMKSAMAGLNLPAGNQKLDGPTALAFARARHGIGDGSDINRIGNQQRLLQAMINQVLSQNIATSSPKLLAFFNAVTKSLTIDKQMSISDMVGVAYSARNINRANITFMTIPWGADPADPNRVVWTKDASIVWSNLAQDKPALTGTSMDPSKTAAPAAGATAAASAPSTSAPSTSASSAPAPAPSTGTQATTPSPSPTLKQAGKQQFSAADTTAVCSS